MPVDFQCKVVSVSMLCIFTVVSRKLEYVGHFYSSFQKIFSYFIVRLIVEVKVIECLMKYAQGFFILVFYEKLTAVEMSTTLKGTVAVWPGCRCVRTKEKVILTVCVFLQFEIKEHLTLAR